MVRSPSQATADQSLPGTCLQRSCPTAVSATGYKELVGIYHLQVVFMHSFQYSCPVVNTLRLLGRQLCAHFKIYLFINTRACNLKSSDHKTFYRVEPYNRYSHKSASLRSHHHSAVITLKCRQHTYQTTSALSFVLLDSRMDFFHVT